MVPGRGGKAGGKGRVIALDLLEMAASAGVTFIQGDFREPQVLAELKKNLGKSPLDLVISDMSPNISGISVVIRRGACIWPSWPWNSQRTIELWRKFSRQSVSG